MFKLKSFDLAYPEITIDTTCKTKPNVLIIGDSFYWNLLHLGINNCFNLSELWYYNNFVYSQGYKKLVGDLDFEAELKKYDVVIILATESNIQHLGWGFIEQAEHCLN